MMKTTPKTDTTSAGLSLDDYMALSYRVQLHEDDDGVTVTNPELPGCVSFGETPNEAITNLREVRRLWIDGRLAAGLEVPEPSVESSFSGKFLLRISKGLHKELHEEAEEQGVSLNSYINELLLQRRMRASQTALNSLMMNSLQTFCAPLQAKVFGHHAAQLLYNPQRTYVFHPDVNTTNIEYLRSTKSAHWPAEDWHGMSKFAFEPGHMLEVGSR